MLILERRNHEWIFVSRIRMIFKCWRHAVRQQKAFLICVKNVLEKSMYMKGFYYIKNSHQDTRYSERVHRYMKRFILKALKINCNDSFNKWKKYSLA
jgi:polyphosphate kinase 2 (PPK2 family)